MADLLKQGLEISALGMGLTFAALAMLILMMIVLERLFRPKAAAGQDTPAPSIMTSTDHSEEEEIAAAIGVAYSYLQNDTTPQQSLGSTLEAGRGAWWRGAVPTRAGRLASRKRKENN
jgi:Na+-transporting methylmalonyl-CoA/oxaloacetate decarboxylase gamma subunit